jgi:hypothetical protein
VVWIAVALVVAVVALRVATSDAGRSHRPADVEPPDRALVSQAARC